MPDCSKGPGLWHSFDCSHSETVCRCHNWIDQANIPTRIAFSVSSQVDSRTIIDSGGAEKLLGRGDMLFAENGSSKTVRLQGTFVSDEEIDRVVNHVKLEQQPKYLFEQEDLLNRAQVTEEADELFFEACEFVVSQQAASASSVQRRFRVGYNRAARLIEMMEQQGVVSESGLKAQGCFDYGRRTGIFTC